MKQIRLKEQKTHGNPIYPVSTYSITCSADIPLLELHWHEELEFLLVTEGSAMFRVDANDYEVHAGEAIFINSGMLHSGYVTSESPCAFQAVVFHANILRGSSVDLIFDQYMNPLIQHQILAPVHLRTIPGEQLEILIMLRQLFDVDQAKKYASELHIKGILYSAMSTLLQMCAPLQRLKADSDSVRMARIKAVVEFIEHSYADQITLMQLAELASMSEAYFCRFFKKITTKSPITYLNYYRVQRAAQLLTSTDSKIMEVALDVGFNSLSYFNTVFRQRFDCTPKQYRKSARHEGVKLLE